MINARTLAQRLAVFVGAAGLVLGAGVAQSSIAALRQERDHLRVEAARPRPTVVVTRTTPAGARPAPRPTRTSSTPAPRSAPGVGSTIVAAAPPPPRRSSSGGRASGAAPPADAAPPAGGRSSPTSPAAPPRSASCPTGSIVSVREPLGVLPCDAIQIGGSR